MHALGNKVHYVIIQLPSGKWQIELKTSRKSTIVDVIIPYFNELRGIKYIAILKMIEILKLRMDSNPNKIRIILLVYSITQAGTRKYSAYEKIRAMVPNVNLSPIDVTKIMQSCINDFAHMVNPVKITLLFVVGLFIGDGNIYVRIRTTTGIYYVPYLRIIQVKNAINYSILQEVKAHLAMYGIKSYIRVGKANFELTIEDKINIKTTLNVFANVVTDLNYYWKYAQVKIAYAVILINDLNMRRWEAGDRLMLKFLYDYAGKNREKDISFYQKKIHDKYYGENSIFEGTNIERILSPYISPVSEKDGTKVVGYIVTFPKALGLKPIQRYFTVYGYNNDLMEAKQQAIIYRDNILNKLEQKLITELYGPNLTMSVDDFMKK